MSVYALALYFWSAVVAVAFVAPVVAALARDAWELVQHVLHHEEFASIPSAPRPSRP